MNHNSKLNTAALAAASVLSLRPRHATMFGGAFYDKPGEGDGTATLDGLTKTLEGITSKVDGFAGKFVSKEDANTLQTQLKELASDVKVLKDNVLDDPKLGLPFKDAHDFWVAAANAHKGDTKAKELFTGGEGYVAKLKGLEELHKAPTGHYTGGNEGEVFILPEFSPEIMRTEPNVMDIRKFAKIIPIKGQLYKERALVDKDHSNSVAGGVRVFRTPEGENATRTKATWEWIEYKPSKVTGATSVTDEMLEDATAFASLLPGLFDDAMRSQEEDDFLYGTGVGEPLGALNANNPALISVVRHDLSRIRAEDVINMKKRARLRNWSRYVWIGGQDIIPDISILRTGTGDQLMYATNFKDDVSVDTLLGRPILYTDAAPTLGAAGDLSLVDWTQYGIGDKGGVKQARSIHVNFLAGEETWKWAVRYDGQPRWRSPFTPKGGGSTQSPFITLDDATA